MLLAPVQQQDGIVRAIITKVTGGTQAIQKELSNELEKRPKIQDAQHVAPVRSRPSHAMLAVISIVALVILFFPYSPLVILLGFTGMSPLYLSMILAVVAIYFVSEELAKRRFDCQIRNHG